MDANFFELFMLYDINSLSVPQYIPDFLSHVLEKATRLFGVTKMAVVLIKEGKISYTWKWGMDIQLDRLDISGLYSQRSVVYDLKDRSGFIFFEQTNSITPRERRLYQIFLHNVEMIIQKYRSDEKLLLSQKEKETILNSFTEKLIYLDLEKRVVWANQKTVESAGMPMNQLIGKQCHTILCQGDQACKDCPVDHTLATGTVQESVIYLPDGRVFHIRACPVVGEHGKVHGVVEMFYDITERTNAAEAIEISERKYRGILETMYEGYFEIDTDAKILEFNNAASRMIGYSRSNLTEMSFLGLCLEKDRMKKLLAEVFESEKPSGGFTTRLLHTRKGSIYTELSVTPLRTRGGNIAGFSIFAWDITERKQHEDTMKYLSLHDQLTGLYNRTFFDDYIEKGTAAYPVTVISIDLDGLKLINDTMGHAMGDTLIKSCSRILQKMTRSQDILIRLGGDEFCVLLPDTDEKTGARIAAEVRQSMEEHTAKNPRLPLSLSMGVAASSREGQPIYEIVKKSDDRMYHDKLYRSNSVKSQLVNALLTVLAEKDDITHGHGERLQDLCLKIAEKINLSHGNRSNLALFSRVHDLGKVGISDHILQKDGPLTEEEWEEMRQHSEKGYRIASSSPELLHVSRLILLHHEQWDGNGYPFGLKDYSIPVECRILAIVDAFDAMTNDRSYRKSMTTAEAVNEILRCKGTQFDPELVDVFISVLNE